ncbi:MAG: PAS domain S-box protein [Desulfomonile tiedjei]|nr:PAS domain S-box protein [Desulfomonile tiedjei]
MTEEKPTRVLYVEEDRPAALLLQEKLVRAGYSVELAFDGEQGLAMLEQNRYDAVAVDQQIPFRTGLELIRTLSLRDRLPATVMIAGAGNEMAAVEAMKLGAMDYLIKDKAGRYRDLLPAVIERAVEKKRLLDEKRRVEQAIARAKADWERTFDAVPDLVAIIGKDFRIRRVNRSMASRLGMTPQEVVGATCYSLVHQGGAPPDTCPHRQLMQDGQEHTAETYEAALGGTFLVSASPIRDADGELIGCVHVARDLTERKKAEEALRVSEQKYRMLVENAPVGILSADYAGRILEVNPQILKILVIESVGAIEPANMLTFPPFVEAGIAEVFGRCLTQERVVHAEVPHTDPSGRQSYLSTIATPMWDSAGRVTGGQAVVEDITDRKQAEKRLRESEEKFRSLFDSSRDGIACVSLDGRVEDANQAFLDMLGYTVDDIKVMRYRHFTPEKWASVDEAAYEEQILKRGYSDDTEQEYIRRDGTVIPVAVRAWLVRDEQGQPLHLWRVVRDITQRKKGERLAVETERIKAVGELAGGIAHNFNNLLQVVLGAAQLAQADVESGCAEDAKEALNQIVQSARFGAETIKRLQYFARVRREDLTVRGEVFDLSEIVHQAIEISKPWWKTSAETEGMRIALRRDLEQGCMVKGRQNELFEVVVNLIKNATEAIRGDGEIIVTSHVSAGKVVVSVSDTGCGIPKENLGNIFEPFWTTKGVEGTGMGLASSYGIVKEHQGELAVQSELGKGTTFTVSFPPAASMPEEKLEAVDFSPTGRKRILVVDDLEPLTIMLKHGFENLGHTVYTALSGRDAMTLFRETEIDLIVCDLAMPELNGRQVAEAVKEICEVKGIPKTPFILLTGWGAQLGDAAKMAESGVDRVVDKPADVPQLMMIASELFAKVSESERPSPGERRRKSRHRS